MTAAAEPSPPTSTATPDDPPAAATVFGDRLGLARRYAAMLVDQAVVRGLIGPREVPRLWERHLLNCAVVADLLPTGARVVDVGSGAGLPGLALAIRRPDLRVDLVEPMQRRIAFLDETVHALGLGDTVRVFRGRADDASVRATVAPTSWVVARAVAPLGRLATWCLPLLGPSGRLLAMKGRSAAAEVEEYRASTRRPRGAEVVTVETPGVDAVRVVVMAAR